MFKIFRLFGIQKVSFTRDYAGNVFYVFVVLHPEGTRTSIIYPESKLEELIHSNAIKDLSNLEKFRVTLKLRNGHFHIGTMDNIIDQYYINNWGIIK